MMITLWNASVPPLLARAVPVVGRHFFECQLFYAFQRQWAKHHGAHGWRIYGRLPVAAALLFQAQSLAGGRRDGLGAGQGERFQRR